VSLHAWPPYGMVNIDIFSCEDFDVNETITFAQVMFHTKDIEVHVVERALRSPRMSTKLALQR
jgi:S-adenosylmethionine decarboxylase